VLPVDTLHCERISTFQAHFVNIHFSTAILLSIELASFLEDEDEEPCFGQLSPESVILQPVKAKYCALNINLEIHISATTDRRYCQCILTVQMQPQVT